MLINQISTKIVRTQRFNMGRDTFVEEFAPKMSEMLNLAIASQTWSHRESEGSARKNEKEEAERCSDAEAKVNPRARRRKRIEAAMLGHY